MVEYLLKKGISSISVNADAAYDVSLLIKQKTEERFRAGNQQQTQTQQPIEQKSQLPVVENEKPINIQNYEVEEPKPVEIERPEVRQVNENISPVEPFDNMDRIEDKAGEVKQAVEERKLEQQEQQTNQQLITGSESVNSEKSQITEQSMQQVQELQKKEENTPYMAEGEPKETNLGVYNPNEQPKDRYDNYKYNFEDKEEDEFSDVF